MTRWIPWQLRYWPHWVDLQRLKRELRDARRHGRAVLSVSGGMVLE